MQKKRILTLKTYTVTHPKCVLYCMSRDQRVHDNHALLAAQAEALENELPLVVMFNLLPKAGVRAREHFAFMIAGLKEVEQSLKALNIPFVLTHGDMTEQVPVVVEKHIPRSVYFDCNPLRGPRAAQKKIAASSKASFYVVDTHNVIPLWVASDKQEFAAHTFRRKVHKQFEQWLVAPGPIIQHPHVISDALDVPDWARAERGVDGVASNGSSVSFVPGEKAAHEHLDSFISESLEQYAALRNDPSQDGVSGLSPYLHFGHISSLRVALEVSKKMTEPLLLTREARMAKYEGAPTLNDSANTLIEEMIVRKELADNYCFYTEKYDSIEGAWQWAKDTLQEHKDDEREYVYDLEAFENAATHDNAWNAAQNQMVQTGKMHGYMRMYWAKKILEWSTSAEEAIATAIYLNDHYSIDGGDPNGYVGIMWSIAGVHDRAWTERAIFGKIRFMNKGGLERKFDIKTYITRWTS